MQETFIKLEHGHKILIQDEAEFTTFAKYAPHLIPTTEKKCYSFLQGLNRELIHPLVPLWIHEFFELVEQARLIEINLVASTSRYEVGSRYYVSKKRSRDEPSRERDNNKKNRYSDLRGSASITFTGSYSECIHCG